MKSKYVLICRWILFTDNYKLLTPWEDRFIWTIFNPRWELTPKQEAKLDEIYKQIRFTERSKFTRSEYQQMTQYKDRYRFGADITPGDYAYIHDFDK